MFRAFVSLAVLIWVAAAAPALADTRYAEPGGDGPVATCPEADPCSLTNAAMSLEAVDGDEVIVLPGTYSLGASPLIIGRALNVHGAAGQPTPTVTGSAPGQVVGVLSDGAVLSDLAIVGSGSAALRLGSGRAERVHATLTSIGYACSLQGGVLRDSICHALAGGTGIYAGQNAPPASITPIVRNVTSRGQGHPAANGILAAAGSGVFTTINVRNTIVDGAGSDVYATTTGSGFATVALENSNFQTRATSGSNITVTDPGAPTIVQAGATLVDPAGGDFHQVPGSPTIDAGVNDALLGSFDFEGQARDGTAPDIGADEFQSAPETSITKAPKKVVRTGKKKAKYKFAFASSEAGQFNCSLDGAAASECVSPIGGRVKRGKHTFAVTAIDGAGNADTTSAVHKWKVKRKRR